MAASKATTCSQPGRVAASVCTTPGPGHLALTGIGLIGFDHPPCA